MVFRPNFNFNLNVFVFLIILFVIQIVERIIGKKLGYFTIVIKSDTPYRLIKYEPEQETEGSSSNSGNSEWAMIKPPTVRVAAIGKYPTLM